MNMWQRIIGLCSLMLVTSLCELQNAKAQSRSESADDCGAEICLQTGVSNWQAEPSDYCGSGVCLQDKLENLVSLDWDGMTGGQDSLIVADVNPFIGLTDAEYQRLRELGDDDIEEQVQLLGKVRVSCQSESFSLSLNVPGRDIVDVVFGTPLVENGGSQPFQVIRIDRTYRSLPGGSMGWWIRWLSYRYPGIVLLEGAPTAFASYEMGLYLGKVVLYDTEFQYGQPADYGRHPDCPGRSLSSVENL